MSTTAMIANWQLPLLTLAVSIVIGVIMIGVPGARTGVRTR